MVCEVQNDGTFNRANANFIICPNEEVASWARRSQICRPFEIYLTQLLIADVFAVRFPRLEIYGKMLLKFGFGLEAWKLKTIL